MSVTASTALDPIFALALNVLNGIVSFFTSITTNQTAIVNAIIVGVTILVIYKFGDRIVGIFDGMFGMFTGKRR